MNSVVGFKTDTTDELGSQDGFTTQDIDYIQRLMEKCTLDNSMLVEGVEFESISKKDLFLLMTELNLRLVIDMKDSLDFVAFQHQNVYTYCNISFHSLIIKNMHLGIKENSEKAEKIFLLKTHKLQKLDLEYKGHLNSDEFPYINFCWFLGRLGFNW